MGLRGVPHATLRADAGTPAELHRCAEARLRERRKNQGLEAGDTKPAGDSRRLLHELQVHEVELEMQNAEL